MRSAFSFRRGEPPRSYQCCALRDQCCGVGGDEQRGSTHTRRMPGNCRAAEGDGTTGPLTRDYGRFAEPRRAFRAHGGFVGSQQGVNGAQRLVDSSNQRHAILWRLRLWRGVPFGADAPDCRARNALVEIVVRTVKSEKTPGGAYFSMQEQKCKTAQ